MAKTDKVTAYEGLQIVYAGRTYELEPEIRKSQCLGCALYNTSCTEKVTKLCTKGFILKKVDKK